LVQDVLRVDQNHLVSGAVHQLDLKIHHVPEDLLGGVLSLAQMVCAGLLMKGDVPQSELDAPLALNCQRDVKGGMGVVLYLPSYFSPSRF